MKTVVLKSEKGNVITCSPDKAKQLLHLGYKLYADGSEYGTEKPKRRGRPAKKTE